MSYILLGMIIYLWVAGGFVFTTMIKVVDSSVIKIDHKPTYDYVMYYFIWPLLMIALVIKVLKIKHVSSN